MKTFTPVAAFLLGIAAIACSILKNDDPEKKVRSYLRDFQTNLAKADDEILANFHVKQSREAVLSIIRILQNKDPFIVCDAAIANAKVSFEKENIKIEISTQLHVKNLDSKDTMSLTFVMTLTPFHNSFQITQLEGEAFYQAFIEIKNRNRWEAERKLALQERLWVYEKARKLEDKFDSVIWYVTYGRQNYFYVVAGNWNNYFLNHNRRGLKNTNARMGLVDAEGEFIIPLEYDLIGTIGFEKADLVEVIKNGKVGYFNIRTKQLVMEPVFDFIVPYRRENVWIVKQDSTYGWIDENFHFTEGFVSKKMEDWLYNFEFLRQTIRLKSGNYSFCEVPSADYTGNGIIIPPAYLSRHGIFDEIESGYCTTEVPVNGWNDFKETTGSFLENISAGIRAVVTTIRERYLEGREEFYTSNTVLFVNNKLDTLNVAILGEGEVSMHPIDSTLLEVRTPHDFWFMENDACIETNLYYHAYFSISAKNEIVRLHSDRLFPQTEFVKLDSSYITGQFLVYNNTIDREESTTVLSVKTLTFMRDEILASYGYRFPDNVKIEHFKYLGKKIELTLTMEEVEAQLSDIDKHNVAFLNKMLEQLESAPAHAI